VSALPAPVVTAVVPTLGRSPLLAGCLTALRQDAGVPVEILVVDQAPTPVELPAGLADQVLRPGANRGFAGGTNLGIDAARAAYIATVNDDALVQPGWAALLLARLQNDPGMAAAQGVNLLLDSETGKSSGLADGWGMAWKSSWQAVQLGHGEAALPTDSPVREVFGVSATAALYRRSALEAVRNPAGQVFDERLGSYYEDVDLAVRLRAAGWRAELVPDARALHAGSVTGRALGSERLRRLYGNRILVLARLLGSDFWPHLPAVAGRDLRDVLRNLTRGELSAVLGIAMGWGRAVRHLRGYARRGEPAVPLAEVAQFGVGRRG
jgi:O-antigen biosynthesis protein